MKLEFQKQKPNKQTIQFRTNINTKKKMDELKKFYGVGTGELIKEMINKAHKFLHINN